MTSEQHVAEADRILGEVNRAVRALSTDPNAAVSVSAHPATASAIAEAQVHATLAVARALQVANNRAGSWDRS